MLQAQSKIYLIFSCLFHIFACVIIFFSYGLLLQKQYKPKHEKIIDISFSTVEQINKSVLYKKTSHKTTQKSVIKPLQKIVQKPVSILKKAISPQPLQPISSIVKIADSNQKPLSQIKSQNKQTFDNNINNYKKSYNTLTQKDLSASQEADNYASKSPLFNKNNYIAYVKQKIADHKFYPISAKRRAIEGRVGLKISIKPTGDIASLHIANSSGSDILDNAAIKSVRDASPFKKTSEYVNFSFGINYYFE